MSPNTLCALLLGAPLAAFLLLAVVPPLRRWDHLPAFLVCGASTVSLVAAAALMKLQVGSEIPVANWSVRWMPIGGETAVEVGWFVDGVAAPMLFVVGLVALCVQVYSVGYLDEESAAGKGRYFTYHALFVVVMQALVLAPNLLQLFMGWELVGLCSYLLIGFWWRKPEAGKAAVKAFWVTKLADGGLLLGLVVLATASGGFDWSPAGMDQRTLTAISLLLFMGVMGKSAQVPLHIWLPDAMQGPTPVSALLHAATMVAAGVYLVVRGWPLFEAAPVTLEVLCWVGGVTAFTAACLAMLQDDVKKMLAYSTCSQLGYMVAALGAGGMVGAYFHLGTHAFFKALLFLCAGSVIHATGTNSMREMGGLSRPMRWTAGLYIIGALALAGIFPLSGFYSKDLVLEALHHGHKWVPLGLCLVTVALTAAYMWRSALLIFAGESRGPGGHAHESGLAMMMPMVVLAIGSIVAGKAFVDVFHVLVTGHPAHFHFTSLGGLGLGLAFLGMGAGWWSWKGGSVGALSSLCAWVHKGPVDRIWVQAYRQALLGFAAVVAWIDRYVVDGLINAVGWAMLRNGTVAGRLQTSRIDQYLMAVAMGAIAFAVFSAMGA